ncbi:MAG TPA: precorrin-6A/cobalt-precorrin-6A reductase, partial [Paracoccaceae bacterium]|nr:precorrin-6A/cobalt-precorrin-6A reductase [Paracoccaceae bacterium]
VTTGREDLSALHSLPARVFLRVMQPDPGPCPLRHGRFVSGKGPFTVAQEQRLLRDLRIDWLIVRNAGGPGGWPKLAAARALRLPVALIRRPAPPPGLVVETIAEVMTWIATK